MNVLASTAMELQELLTRRRITSVDLVQEYLTQIANPNHEGLKLNGSAAGFPVTNLPLGFAHFNGRPFSLHIIAPANEEARLLQENTFPENDRPPALLVEGEEVHPVSSRHPQARTAMNSA